MPDYSFYYPSLIAPYKSWSDTKLVAGSGYIFNCLQGNDYFTSLATEVTAYGNIVNAFRTQVELAGNRDKNAVAAKNVMRNALIAATISIANAVTQAASGNIQALVSSGMELRKKPQPIELEAPVNLVITAGPQPGQLKTKVDVVKGARSYIARCATDPEAPATQWTIVNCSRSQCVISGLPSGTKQWVVIGALGSNHNTAWSAMQLSPFVP